MEWSVTEESQQDLPCPKWLDALFFKGTFTKRRSAYVMASAIVLGTSASQSSANPLAHTSLAPLLS